MMLRIRSRDGLERVSVENPNAATVSDLKRLIETQLGIPIHNQTLSTNQNLLLSKSQQDLLRFTDMSNPNTPLSSLNLGHGSIVFLTYEGERRVPGPAFNPAGSFGRKMTMDDLIAKQMRVTRQETPHCEIVSFDRDCANAFQHYVNDTLAFAVKRGGFMYGTVSDEGKVEVDFIYEPPQQGSEDNLVFFRDPDEEKFVDAIAMGLGMREWREERMQRSLDALANSCPLDLARAIFYNILDKGKITVAMECEQRSDCVPLKYPELLEELYEIRKCLTWTILFSKKRFSTFLFAAGLTKEDVIRRKRTARTLKPAYTVLRDKQSKSIFLFIRGTHSIKDTLTDAVGGTVSFKHKINCSDGDLSMKKEVSGYAHRGMASAATWIREDCIDILIKNLSLYSDFQVKVVGHSLGGGTAALLTFMLREVPQPQFSSATCVTFGSAACMTLELAEFGKHFITSFVNGNDMVPTLSASSIRNFISEPRIKRRKIIKDKCSSIISRLPFKSTVKPIPDPPVTHGTQVVVMKNKQRTRSLIPWTRARENPAALSSSKSDNSAEVSRSLIPWIRPRENPAALSSSKSDNLAEVSRSSETSYEEITISHSTSDEDDGSSSSSEESDNEDIDEEEQMIISATHDQNIATPTVCDDIANEEEDEFLNQCFKEFEIQDAEDDIPNNYAQEKELAPATMTNGDISTEGKIIHVVHTEENGGAVTEPDKSVKTLYPPGRIIHIVSAPILSQDSDSNDDLADENHVLSYETPTNMYGKLRFSKRMIFDHSTSKYLKTLQNLSIS